MHESKAGTVARIFALVVLAIGCAANAADPAKVLRIASLDIETFDPQQFNDNPSFEVFTAIFEGLYEYDYLVCPYALKPLLAARLP